jgi:anti-sigma factor RsiW
MEREVLTSALRPGADCLSIEQLGRYADGALSFADRAIVAAHVEACANCQAELALLHSFATALIRDDEQATVRSGVEALRRREPEIFGRRSSGEVKRAAASPLVSLRAIVSVAAVLLAVVGGYYLLKSSAPSLPADMRTGSAVTRALAVAVVGPEGDQATMPERFEWRSVDGAVRYHVQLMEVDRHELWSTDTVNTAIEVPANVRPQIVPGKTLLWQVTAVNDANAPIAQSDMLRFRVSRP